MSSLAPALSWSAIVDPAEGGAETGLADGDLLMHGADPLHKEGLC